MKNKKKGIILTILAVLSLIVITIGVTYSFFTYIKEGTTENTITSDKIKFIYDEKENQVGNGIKIENALPMSDELGKAQTGSGNVFNFKIASTTPNTISIPYKITIKKDSSSTLDEKLIKVYLAKVNGMVENQVALGNFSVEAGETTKVGLENYGTNEKLLYSGRIPTSTPNYEQNFVLKMWIDEDADFSPTVDGEGNSTGTSANSNKTFKARVNVYANGKILTNEEVEKESSAKLTSVKVGDSSLTKLTDPTLSYQYETTLPLGTTETTIEVEPENEYANVKIEKVDSLAQATTSEAMIQRLSTRNTVAVKAGDNYFRVTVTPEKGTSASTIIKVTVESLLLKNLSASGCTLNPTFTSGENNYSCTVEGSVTKTTVTAEPIVTGMEVEGIGEHNLTVGENTINVTLSLPNDRSNTYVINITRKEMRAEDKIKEGRTIITNTPTLTNSSNGTSDASGLYKSTATNSGKPTYYFRGNVTNNYLDFAGFVWRVVRINEDGTIRIILNDSLYNGSPTSGYRANPNTNDYTTIYYSNWSDSDGYAKGVLKKWYNTNIVDKGYSGSVASGTYFCEQAKVAFASNYLMNAASTTVYSSYTPNFMCTNDANGKGLVSSSYGLLTYDEVVFAGGYYNNTNNQYYLNVDSSGNTRTWLMSPNGAAFGTAYSWILDSNGDIFYRVVDNGANVRPVINLNANTVLTGTGASDKHWEVQ